MNEEQRKEKVYVAILAAIQFAHILDFVIMMPLGPQFMSLFHITPSEFSLVVSVYTISAGILGLAGALWGDHWDRKKFLLVCFVGFIIGTWICAEAQTYRWLIFGRVVAGAFGGILNAIVMALVSDLIPPVRRGLATGVIMSAFSMASVVGVPIGLLIANRWNYSAAFYFILTLSLLILTFAIFTIPTVLPSHTTKTIIDKFKNLLKVFTVTIYQRGFLMSMILSTSVFLIVPFISAYMVQNVGLTQQQLPLIYLVGGFFTIISSRTIGKLCDRYGSFEVFKILLPLSLIPLTLLTHLPQVPLPWALGTSTLFMMLVSGRFIPIMTLNSLIVRHQDRGTFMGLENSLRQLAAGLAAYAGGAILSTDQQGKILHYSINGYLSILLSLIALMMASRVYRQMNELKALNE